MDGPSGRPFLLKEAVHMTDIYPPGQHPEQSTPLHGQDALFAEMATIAGQLLHEQVSVEALDFTTKGATPAQFARYIASGSMTEGQIDAWMLRKMGYLDGLTPAEALIVTPGLVLHRVVGNWLTAARKSR